MWERFLKLFDVINIDSFEIASEINKRADKIIPIVNSKFLNIPYKFMLDYTLCFKKGVKLIIKKFYLQKFLALSHILVLIYN